MDAPMDIRMSYNTYWYLRKCHGRCEYQYQRVHTVQHSVYSGHNLYYQVQHCYGTFTTCEYTTKLATVQCYGVADCCLLSVVIIKCKENHQKSLTHCHKYRLQLLHLLMTQIGKQRKGGTTEVLHADCLQIRVHLVQMTNVELL